MTAADNHRSGLLFTLQLKEQAKAFELKNAQVHIEAY